MAQSSLEGQWDGPWDWTQLVGGAPTCNNFDEFAHAALLPLGTHAGTVLLWRLDSDPPPGCGTNGTTESWLFSPTAPSKLIRVIHDPLASDIFCAGLSWDGAGKLVVVGGVGANEDPIPEETYRFNPRVLPLAAWPPSQGGGPPGDPYLPSSDCWETVGDMNIGRYYPTLVRLLDRALAAGSCTPAVGSPHLALGGPPTIAAQDGNEVWELLQNGAAGWDCPLLPETTPSHWNPAWAGNNERYTLEPQIPPGEPPHFELLDSYPRAYHLSNYQLFVAGDVNTIFEGVNPKVPPGNVPGTSWGIAPPYLAGEGWELWEGPDSSDRYYGSAVLLHTLVDKDRVLVFGGAEYSGGWNVLDTVGEYERGSANAWEGAWHLKTSMQDPRAFCNAIPLPTGKILILGGSSSFSGPNPVFRPELYDPGTFPSTAGPEGVPMAQSNVAAPTPTGGGTQDASTPRLYHSLAVLLLDGRILVAGGSNEYTPWPYPESAYSGELYSPPYLFQGTRPVILSTDTRVPFDVAFEVEASTSQGSIDRVVLLRPAALTHHFDNDQRYIELAFTDGGGAWPGTNLLTVTAPGDDLAPKGYYMLFVVELKTNGDRVPSVAKLVRFL